MYILHKTVNTLLRNQNTITFRSGAVINKRKQENCALNV